MLCYNIKFIVLGFVFCMVTSAYALVTINPRVGTIQKSFTEPAETTLEDFYEINMPLTGKLEYVEVREGNIVKKNQVIAKLTQEPWVQVVNIAKGKLATFKAQLLLQEKTLERREDLRKKGFVGEEELDEIRAQVKVLRAQIAQTEAELAVAEYNLRESIIRSPIDGIILNRYSSGGKWLLTGDPLFRIGDFAQMEVICDVLTQEAQQLKIGDTVLLTSIGSPIVLRGRVQRIYPAGFTKKSALGVDEQRVNVIITIANPEQAELQVGYRVQAEFLIGSQEKKALLVPRFSVLQDREGNYYVFAVENNKLRKKNIQIGIQTDEVISVIKGIAVQDKIIEQPTAQMYDGMKI